MDWRADKAAAARWDLPMDLPTVLPWKGPERAVPTLHLEFKVPTIGAGNVLYLSPDGVHTKIYVIYICKNKLSTYI